MHWLQKGATLVLVLGISTLIFFLLTSDKQMRQSVLRPTLEALGEQLFAAVRDDGEKEQLEANYRDFMRSAEEQSIDSDAVEKVAAQILNLSGRDSVISARDALALLAHADENPAAAGAVSAPVRRAPRPISGFYIEKSPNPSWSKADLAERLKAMQEFQRELEILARDSEEQRRLLRQYRFQPSDSGLRVMVDVDLRELLPTDDSLFRARLKKMEEKQWLKWRHAIPPPPSASEHYFSDRPAGSASTGRILVDPGLSGGWPEGVYIDTTGSGRMHIQIADSVGLSAFGRQMVAWGIQVARTVADSSLLRQLDSLQRQEEALAPADKPAASPAPGRPPIE